MKKVKLVACKDDPNFYCCPRCGDVYDGAFASHVIWNDKKQQDEWKRIKYCKCGAFIRTPKTKEVVRKGYIVRQSEYNYHEWIIDVATRKPKCHSQKHHPMSRRELVESIDNFIKLRKMMNEGIFLEKKILEEKEKANAKV